MFGIFEDYIEMAHDSAEKAYEERDLALFLLLFQAYFFPLFLLNVIPRGEAQFVSLALIMLTLANIMPMIFWALYFFKVQKETFINHRQTQLQEYSN